MPDESPKSDPGHPRADARSTLRARATIGAKSSLPLADHLAGEAASDARPRSLPGYVVLEELGHGATGFVFRARQANLERDVALKTARTAGHADEGHRVRFLSEALVTGSLDHPNVVPAHDLVFDEVGEPSLAMKLIGGVTWDALLHPTTDEERARAAPYGLDRHLEILHAVCNAVAFAHSRGIIHRDLKPTNVMVGEFGEVLVTDWGLAVSVDGPSHAGGWRAPDRSCVTDPEGTPAYMAPEMAAGRGDALSPASDVYLLGAILFEIATGAPPHVSDSVAGALTAASRAERPPFPPGIPRELQAICDRAMALDPAERYPDAAAFQRALREYSSHRQSVALADDASARLAAARARAATEVTEEGRAALYGDLTEAASGFRQATLLWPENEPAVHGELDARAAHARIALDNGDLALARTLVSGLRGPDAESLAREVDAARAARERDARRGAALRRARVVIGVVLLALLLTAGFLLWSMGEIGDRIAVQMRDGLSDEAHKSLQRSVEEGVRELAKVRSRAELGLYIYAHELAAHLAAPSAPTPPSREPLWSSDIDARRVDPARLVDLPRYERVQEGGGRVSSPISLEDQSFFAPSGADESRVREEVARLAAVVPTIRWLYDVNPQVARFFAALADTRLYVQYPGSGNLPAGYDPTRRDWYSTGLHADGIALTPPYRDATTEQLVISAVMPLRDGTATLGVAGVDFDVDSLLDSRRPDQRWREQVLVSLVRVQKEPHFGVFAVLGQVPGVSGEIGREDGREVEITADDERLRDAFHVAFGSDPPAVAETSDGSADWLWAFAQLPRPFARRDLFLAMAAPTREVTADADDVDASIREETQDQLRSTAVRAGIALAVVLALVAAWAYRGTRPRDTSPPRPT
jgi:hypothetical protein